MTSLTGWDISPTSIEATRAAVLRMKVSQPVDLAVNDILQPQGEACRFDVVTMCEVLEHLEKPEAALTAVRRLMAPGGRLFVSVPINSPAPDHIYLLRTPEEAAELLQRNGFDILGADSFPTGGYALERAKRLGVTISCALIAESAAD